MLVTGSSKVVFIDTLSPLLRPLFTLQHYGRWWMVVDEPTFTVSLSPGAPAASGSTPVTPHGVQVGSPSQPAPLLTSTQGKTGPGCHPDFPDADKLNARALEPAFESMLRQAEVCDDVILVIRLQEIHPCQLFAALDRSEERLCDTCKEAFHIHPSLGFKHKRELGRLLTVWNTAKVQRDTKVQIEAVRRAHLHDRCRLDVSDPHVQSEVWKQPPFLSFTGAIELRRL